MKTVTVKLNKSDYEMLNQVVKWLQQDWIEKMTKSEAIRYAIYTLYCDKSESYPNKKMHVSTVPKNTT